MANRPVGRRRNPDDPGPVEPTEPVTVTEDDAAWGGDVLAEPDALAESDGPGVEPAQTALPKRVESWRKRSATGAMLTGFALGLQQVFEPERKEPAIVMETSGAPPSDLPVEAELEMATTRRSVVRIRPWLLDEGAGALGALDDAPEQPATDEPVDEAGH